MKTFTQDWKDEPPAPPDKIFGLKKFIKADKNPKKVNLTIGVYRDNFGKKYIPPSVWEASRRLLNQSNEYLSPIGDKEFTKLSVELAYGKKNGLLAGKYQNSQIIQAQSLSGTGGLFLMMETLKHFYKPLKETNTVYLSTPTWPNHQGILKKQGLRAGLYSYYDLSSRQFVFEKMQKDIRSLPEKSVVMFHVCGHNPTGQDPSPAQWEILKDICLDRKLFVLFDMAYQGFVTGDYEKDAYPVRLFAEEEVPLMLSQSFAKNFGLYGQRVGCFSIPCKNKELVVKMEKFLGQLIRRTYSNNPRYGSDIVKTVLGDRMLKQQWMKDLKTMADRIDSIRQKFHHCLMKYKVSGDWEFLLKQRGMFTFTTMTVKQIVDLRKRSVYMLDNGRISLSGLNDFNVDYVAKSIKEVVGQFIYNAIQFQMKKGSLGEMREKELEGGSSVFEQRSQMSFGLMKLFDRQENLVEQMLVEKKIQKERLQQLEEESIQEGDPIDVQYDQDVLQQLQLQNLDQQLGGLIGANGEIDIDQIRQILIAQQQLQQEVQQQVEVQDDVIQNQIIDQDIQEIQEINQQFQQQLGEDQVQQLQDNIIQNQQQILYNQQQIYQNNGMIYQNLQQMENNNNQVQQNLVNLQQNQLQQQNLQEQIQQGLQNEILVQQQILQQQQQQEQQQIQGQQQQGQQDNQNQEQQQEQEEEQQGQQQQQNNQQ